MPLLIASGVGAVYSLLYLALLTIFTKRDPEAVAGAYNRLDIIINTVVMAIFVVLYITSLVWVFLFGKQVPLEPFVAIVAASVTEGIVRYVLGLRVHEHHFTVIFSVMLTLMIAVTLIFHSWSLLLLQILIVYFLFGRRRSPKAQS